MAPPHMKFTEDSAMLLFALYGAVGGGSGACVLVNPTTVIIESGGTQGFCSLLPASSKLGNSVVRYGPPPAV